MSGILQTMMAAGGRSAFLPAAGISVTQITSIPTPATATIQFSAAGTFSSTPAGTSGTWLTGGGTGADYEIRLTVSSGTPSGDTTNTWLSMSSGRQWFVQKTGGTAGVNQATGTLEIRDAATLSVAASCSLSLYAEVA